MELKTYYKKLRELESVIVDAHVLVSSLETPDGGRAGVLTEASRRIAARLILKGKARLAGDDEAKAFREELAAARREAEQTAMAGKVQVTLVQEQDPRRPGGATKLKT